MHQDIEQSAEEAWAGCFEVPPEFVLCTPLRGRDSGWGNEQRAVGEIGAHGDVFDAVDDLRPLYVEELLIGISVQFAVALAAAGRKAAETVGEPLRQEGEIIEGYDVSIARGDEG